MRLSSEVIFFYFENNITFPAHGLYPAREVQKRRGDGGPLEPDHLREAYRMYQEETGKVGAARPVRAKKLFVK